MGDAVGKVVEVGTLGLIPSETFEGPDTSELDAMYMSQARETEKRIKALRANATEPAARGIRSGGGKSVQSVPTLTSITQNTSTGKTHFG